MTDALLNLLIWYFYGSYIIFALLILVFLRKQFIQVCKSLGYEGEIVVFAGFILWFLSPVTLIALFKIKIKVERK